MDRVYDRHRRTYPAVNL